MPVPFRKLGKFEDYIPDKIYCIWNCLTGTPIVLMRLGQQQTALEQLAPVH